MPDHLQQIAAPASEAELMAAQRITLQHLLHQERKAGEGLPLPNDPKLLDRHPSPPPLRTRQNRNLAHVCSYASKSISKLSQARLAPGRRPSPEGYMKALGINLAVAAAAYWIDQTILRRL